jgi:succinyl-diaminopimelate desuccinylase
MACLYALRALIASGAPVKNRLRLLFGCDEETGMGDMRNYLARRKAPDYAFSPDATFPVIHAEKGIVSGAFYADIPQPTALVSLTGGVRLNVVPAFAQAQLRGVGVGRLAAAVDRRAHILLVVENHEIFVKSEGVPAHASTPGRAATPSPSSPNTSPTCCPRATARCHTCEPSPGICPPTAQDSISPAGMTCRDRSRST